MEYKNILYKKEDRVATVTLNHPDKLNALNWQILEELDHALKQAELDDEVGVAIVKGAGRCFSAGYDLEPGTMGHPPKHKLQDGVYHRSSMWNSRAHVQQHIDYWMNIWNNWKPIIAQVHGYCLAGAVELALICDLLIVSEDAKIGNPLVRGQNVGDCMRIMAWHVGIKKAKELQFTGDTLTAEEAVRYGVANYMFPTEKLDEETLAIAKKIAHIPPQLLMLSKMSVNKTFEMMGFRTAMEYDGVWDSLGHFTDTGWEKLFHEKGWKAAAQWRDAPFGGMFGRTFPIKK